MVESEEVMGSDYEMAFTRKANHKFLGSEFDWLAVDRNGFVGFFSTAGQGWIPESVFADPDRYCDTLDLVMRLPVVGEPERLFPVGEVGQDWLDAAARGLYAFDWDFETNRYQLVARPPRSLDSSTESAVSMMAGANQFTCAFDADFPNLDF